MGSVHRARSGNLRHTLYRGPHSRSNSTMRFFCRALVELASSSCITCLYASTAVDVTKWDEKRAKKKESQQWTDELRPVHWTHTGWQLRQGQVPVHPPRQVRTTPVARPGPAFLVFLVELRHWQPVCGDNQRFETQWITLPKTKKNIGNHYRIQRGE